MKRANPASRKVAHWLPSLPYICAATDRTPESELLEVDKGGRRTEREDGTDDVTDHHYSCEGGCAVVSISIHHIVENRSDDHVEPDSEEGESDEGSHKGKGDVGRERSDEESSRKEYDPKKGGSPSCLGVRRALECGPFVVKSLLQGLESESDQGSDHEGTVCEVHCTNAPSTRTKDEGERLVAEEDQSIRETVDEGREVRDLVSVSKGKIQKRGRRD